MKWIPRIFAQFLLGVSVLTNTAGHGVNEGAFHGDEFRNFLVSGSRTVLNGLRDHFNRGVKFPEERFRQTIAEVNTFISGVEQYVSRETSKPGLNFLPSGYSQETPALEELPDSGKKIIFPTQGQSELQPEELEVRGPQIQTEKSIDEPAGKERCDDSKGFFRHDVDGECRELLSWDACPLGYWLVRKKATLTVTCEPHPCGDTSKIFLGPTGECISSENVTMAAMTVCSETQRPLITEKGAVECFCRDGFFSVPSTTTTTSASPPCFQLHTRGPCKDDEVLVMTTSPAVSPTLGAIATTLSAPLSSSRRRKDNPGSADREPNAEPGVPACRRNLCPQAERLAVSEQHGYCFQLGKQEPCKRGHIFDLHPETHKPTCVQSNEDGLGLPNSAIFQNKEVMCQPASVRSYYKQCVKDEPNSSELRETLYTSCSTHGHWKVLDPISKRVVCREVPCSLTNEFLTTSGACENETRFLSSCKSERNSTSVKLALTTHGTVECECGSGHVFWPLDGNCYQVLARGPCGEKEMLVFSGNRAKLRNTNGLECVPALCKGPDQVFVISNGECYTLGTPGPCQNDTERLMINPETLQPYCQQDSIQSFIDDGDMELAFKFGLISSSMSGKRGGLFKLAETFKSCPQGSRRDHNLNCVYAFEFNMLRR